MLTYLRDILDNLVSIVRTMSFVDYLDILLLTVIVFGVIRFVKETRAVQLIKGIVVFMLMMTIIRQFDFKALGIISDSLLNVGMMAVIVMFQPELRRMLEKVGRNNVVRLSFNLEGNLSDIVSRIVSSNGQIAAACERLSRKATGALIVMERQTKLGEQIDTGVVINAEPSEQLLGNIFFPNSPMHDGAVIIRNGTLTAAGCFLPKPQKEEMIAKDLGSRHRAAIGMSEVSDALIIVVSEETGTVSVAENGILTRGLNEKMLNELLNSKILSDYGDNVLKKDKKHIPKEKNKKANKKKGSS